MHWAFPLVEIVLIVSKTITIIICKIETYRTEKLMLDTMVCNESNLHIWALIGFWTLPGPVEIPFESGCGMYLGAQTEPGLLTSSWEHLYQPTRIYSSSMSRLLIDKHLCTNTLRLGSVRTRLQYWSSVTQHTHSMICAPLRLLHALPVASIPPNCHWKLDDNFLIHKTSSLYPLSYLLIRYKGDDNR